MWLFEKADQSIPLTIEWQVWLRSSKCPNVGELEGLWGGKQTPAFSIMGGKAQHPDPFDLCIPLSIDI